MANEDRTFVDNATVTTAGGGLLSGDLVDGYGRSDRLVFMLTDITINTVGTLKIWLQDSVDGSHFGYVQDPATPLFTVTNDAAPKRAVIWAGDDAWADQLSVLCTVTGAGASYTFTLRAWGAVL